MKRDPQPKTKKRTLDLRKQRIRELATQTLDRVVGGMKKATAKCSPTA